MTVKDKWSRIVCGINMNYRKLENCERENHELMRKKRKRTSTRDFARMGPVETQNTASVKKVKMGYNFTIRPKSFGLGKREESRTTDIDKYLNKIRKATKFH